MPDNFSREQDDVIKTVESNCTMLARKTTERVEYMQPVEYPDGVTRHEERTRNVARPGLLTQLEDFAQHKDTDLNPKAARGAPRVKKAKLNPELNGFLCLDEIICDINMSLDKIFEETGLDRTWLADRTATSILTGLGWIVRDLVRDGKDGHAEDIAKLTTKWVAMARRTLNQTIADTMFADVVCGNCNGGLAVPNRIVSGNAVVRCVGTMTTPPCGNEYHPSDWLSLYEGRV